MDTPWLSHVFKTVKVTFVVKLRNKMEIPVHIYNPCACIFSLSFSNSNTSFQCLSHQVHLNNQRWSFVSYSHHALRQKMQSNHPRSGHSERTSENPVHHHRCGQSFCSWTAWPVAYNHLVIFSKK